MAQRYATMNILQQPDSGLSTRVDAEFRLHNSIHPDEYAEAMRYHGTIYLLPSLYDMHQGRQPPLRSFSSVRIAIQRLLQRDAQLCGLENAPDLQSNAEFSAEELCCLLRALLDGTIQHDLYQGRALPVVLIDGHVQYATTQQQNPQSRFYRQRTDDQTANLYIQAITTDSILHITTGAYVKQEDWYESFLQYVHMPDCPKPSVSVRALLRNDPNHASMPPGDANAKVLNAMATHKKHRKHHKVRDSDNDIPPNTTMTSLITTRDLIDQPPNPYFGNNHGYDPSPLTPLRNLVNRKHSLQWWILVRKDYNTHLASDKQHFKISRLKQASTWVAVAGNLYINTPPRKSSNSELRSTTM